MKERFRKIINHPLTIPITVVTVSSGIAYGIGYLVGRKSVAQIHEIPEQLEFDYKAMEDFLERKEAELGIVRVVDVEVEEIKDESSSEVVDVGAEFVAEKIKESMTTSDEELETVDQNIFAQNNDTWDYDEEIKSRSSAQPYIIHKDEFYAEELGYTQTTLTYYAGDDIMADQEDAPVYNHKTVVGELRFGHGSNDPNVFHVRNDKRKAEYEILFDPGLYSEEVLGLEIEDNQRVKNLEHSKIKKFKME